MKTFKLFVIAVSAFVVGTLNVSAQVASLPIGSVDVVLADAIAHVNEIGINVRIYDRDNPYLYQFLPGGFGGFPYSQKDGTKIEDVIRKYLTETISKSIDTNDQSFEGRKFVASYSGRNVVSDELNLWYIMFGTVNEFRLVRDVSGKLTVPESAYKVDLVAALMRGNSHAFFVKGIDYALLEVEDASGNILIEDDSRNYAVGGGEGDIVVNRADEVVGITTSFITSGQPGHVSIWYKNGLKQVFNLADGKLFPPPITVAKATEGLVLTVADSRLVLEESADLLHWSPVDTAIIRPASDTSVRQYTVPVNGSRRFYRAVPTKELQKRN